MQTFSRIYFEKTQKESPLGELREGDRFAKGVILHFQQ